MTTVTEKHRERALRIVQDFEKHGASIHIVAQALATVEAEALERAAQWHGSVWQQALEQYRNDMRYPPAPDSRARRIEWIDGLIGKEPTP